MISGFPQSPRPIHDGHTLRLDPSPSAGGRIGHLRNDDHLLRRFGALETLRLRDGEGFSVQRRVADEIWSLVEGTAKVRLEDRRPDSPTLGAVEVLELEHPTRLLVPFGVRTDFYAAPPGALWIRLMTHDLDEDPPVMVDRETSAG